MKVPRKLSAGELVGPVAYNTLVQFVASLVPCNTPTVRHNWTPLGVMSHASRAAAAVVAGGDLDLSSFYGGILSTDQEHRTITIAPDRVVLDSQASGLTAATVVSIGGLVGAPHYIFAYGTTNPLSIAISPVTTGVFPVRAANQWRRALYEVYVSAVGLVVLNRIIHLGLIDLTSFYRP